MMLLVDQALVWVWLFLLILLPAMYLLDSEVSVLRAHIVLVCAVGLIRLPIVRDCLFALAGWGWRLLNERRWLMNDLALPIALTLLVLCFSVTPGWIGQFCLSLMFLGFAMAQHHLKRIGPRFIAGLVIVLASTALAWLCYFGSVIAPIGVDSVDAFLQSDGDEIRQFLWANTNDNLKRLLAILAACGIILLLSQLPLWRSRQADDKPRLDARLSMSITSQCMLLISALLIAFAAVDIAKFFSSLLANTRQALQTRHADHLSFRQDSPQFGVPKQVKLLAQAPDIIVYIGESTTRHHLGLYGYARDTTPFLSSIASDLVRFDDALAPHSHTARALMEMLTDWNFEGGKGMLRTLKHDPSEALQPMTLLDVLNAGGFQTAWFSNHNRYGIWDNPVTSLAERAQSAVFFRSSLGAYTGAVYYDEFMIEKALGVLAKNSATPRASIIHSYAGHMDYCMNIPPQWRKAYVAPWSSAAYFGDLRKDMSAVDCYDAAMRYIDDNLRRVIEHARNSSKPTVVVYVSDHGDDADNGSGHNSEIHTYQHTDVPLLAYFNESAKLAMSAQLSALKANRTKPFETSDLYHLIADIAQIDAPHVDRSRSPASPEFRVRDRHILPRGTNWLSRDTGTPIDRLDTRDQMEIAQERLRPLEMQVRDKLCIHHVGTLAKLKEARLLLKCVEFDAVFDANTNDFSLFHPPDADIGLDISTYLAAAGDIRFWMDLKNLNETNFEQIFARLNRLDAVHGIRERLILEIGADFLDAHPTPSAFIKASAGWRLSLYLPTNKGMRCRDPSLTETKACVDMENDIQRIHTQFGFTYISYDNELWPWVRDSKRLEPLPSITWDFSEIIQSSDYKFVGRAAFKKSEVFLVPLRSEYAYGQFDCCANSAYRAR